MKRQTDFYGWKLLAIFWLILFTSFAFPLYGASVVNAYMAADLGLNRSSLGLAYGLFQWMIGLPAPLVAILINKKGVRFTATLGSLVVMIGALLMALVVRTGLEVDIVFGIVIGLGHLSTGILGAQSCIGQWFVKGKARAITLVHTGGGIGGFVAAPVLDRVIRHFGGNWRAGWWLIAALSLFAASLAAIFIREKPADLGQVPDGEEFVPMAVGDTPGSDSKAAHSRLAARSLTPDVYKTDVYKTTGEWTFREAFRFPAMWLFLLASLGISAGYPMFLAHGVVHLKDLGFSSSQAASSISIMLLSSLAGQLIVVAWGDRIEPRLIWAAASALFGVGMFLALNARGAAGLYLYAICLGIGFGSSFSSMMTLPGNYFGAKAYASILSVMMAVGTTAGALGPYLAGIVYDHYNTYAPAFYWVAGFSFAATILLLFATPPVRRRAPSLAPVVMTDVD
jgi:MFS transporter, OFA family, oxalate/formate antiporter